MTLKIRPGTVGYNNKILVSDGKFSLGKNDEVNSLEAPAIKNHKTNYLETPAIKNHKANSLETPTIESTAQGLTHAPTISHQDEKAAFILFIAGGFTVWFHKTNSLETPAIKNHKTNSLEIPAIESTAQGLTHAPTISHEDEKAAFILFITGGFTV